MQKENSGVFGSDLDKCVYQIEEIGTYGAFELNKEKTKCAAVFKMNIERGEGKVRVTALFNFGADVISEKSCVYEYKIIGTCEFHYAPSSQMIIDYLEYLRKILNGYLCDANDKQKNWVWEEFVWWDFDPNNIKDSLKPYIQMGLISGE